MTNQKSARYTFRPRFTMTLATLGVMVLCIWLGFWQYDKAVAKEALQEQLDNRAEETPVALPLTINEIDAWRYKRVKFAGHYVTSYQLLLDNQVENGVAGYHVYTPVKLVDSEKYVVVNRGWVAGSLDRKKPIVDTPTALQEFEGDIVFPPDKFFTLEAPQVDDTWHEVWQHLDMARYDRLAPFSILPFVVRLDPHSRAGGFVRNWPAPAARNATHLGYAFQWFGFALTLFIIYIVLNVKKVKLK